jgi:ABC-type polysaccharide/polyol phosphate export permease
MMFNVSRIYFLQLKSWLPWFILQTVLFPIGLIFFVKAIGRDIEMERLLAGALVLTISTTTVNSTGFWIVTDRIQKHHELMISLPINKASYYTGIMFVAVVQSFINTHVLMAFFAFTNKFNYSIAVLITLIISSLIFAAIGMFIGLKAKNTNHATLMLNICGTGLSLMCPIFYPEAALPHIISNVSAIIPHTQLFNILYSLFS